MMDPKSNGRAGAMPLSSAPRGADLAVRQMLDNVRSMGQDRWSARCPCHEDRDNSLAVWLEDGRLGFKCYAGCSPDHITNSLYERFPEYGELLGRARKDREGGGDMSTGEDAKTWYAKYTGVPAEFLSQLPIAFTSTEIIFGFRGIDRYKIRIKGERGALWRGSGHTPDLWPLPGDSVGSDIIITEGESDCVVARYLGLEAYAITKGAAAGLPSSVLVSLRRRGARRLVVVMDADQAGRQAASKIVLAARQAGIAAIDLDLVAEGLVEPIWGQKDLRDAFRAGRGSDIVEAIRHMLYMADEAKPSAPRPLSEIMSEEAPTDFVIDKVLRLGGTAILAGEPKLGKSQLALDIALAISRGEPVLGLETKAGKVIYYALEDGEDIVRDRVRARSLDGNENLFVGTYSPVAGDNVALLEEHIDTIQPTMVIIDTLRATSVGSGRSENEAGFADSLYRVAKLCRERGVSAIVVHHTVKAATGNPVADARGTSAIAGSVDVVIGLYKKDDALKLIWRGRYGSGEIKLQQHSNGSFNYQPSTVVDASKANEEYMRRVEERLAMYEAACRRHADKNGRVDVRRVVLAVWGTKDGRYPEGAWDKTYKALDELVRRHRLRKKERQYYVSPEPQGAWPSSKQDNGPDSSVTSLDGPQALPSESVADMACVGGAEIRASEREPAAGNTPDVSGERADAPPAITKEETKTHANMTAKRSLLKEARSYMEVIFRGGGEFADKIRKYAWKVYEGLRSGNYDEVDKLLVEAYGIVEHEGPLHPKDERYAIEALDIAFFLRRFAMSDEEQRAIAWKIWDARAKIRGDLYDYMWLCCSVLDMVREGHSLEDAIKWAAETKGIDVTPFFEGYDAQKGV